MCYYTPLIPTHSWPKVNLVYTEFQPATATQRDPDSKRKKKEKIDNLLASYILLLCFRGWVSISSNLSSGVFGTDEITWFKKKNHSAADNNR